MTRREAIRALKDEVRSVVSEHLSGSGPVALLDFPSHGNVGDSAIWLAALRLLGDLGVGPPDYVCGARTCDLQRLRERVRGGTILLTGGGNLGDLYPHHQEFRELVVESFPDVSILQLPQSIFFRSRRKLERARRVFEAHPRLTLLVRDERSLALAREEFDVRSHLCPDLAFYLGPLPRTEDLSRDCLHLLREDGEADISRRPVPHDAVDWVEEPRSPLRASHDALSGLGRGIGWRPLRNALWSGVHATYRPLARQRLERGVSLLSSARTVVTDRLHGHILCLLLGIPHLVVDDRYGKVDAFRRTWTSGFRVARTVRPRGRERPGDREPAGAP